MKHLDKLIKAGVAHPPKFLLENLHYAVQMGSVAYGVSTDDSDFDVGGFCILPKEMTFPHLAGEIPGFGTQLKRFEQYQEHHMQVPGEERVYDFTIYSIVKFFQLCMENNPNILDTLFVPNRCVLHITQVGQNVRDNRKLFLTKESMKKLRGYAYAQKSAILQNRNSTNEKRAADIEQFGYSTKFAYHLIRLVLQAEQILLEGDLDLEANREHLKAIRRGEFTVDEIMRFFDQKERDLEILYATSKLRQKPEEDKLKQLLLECLEHHYGSISQAVTVTSTEAMLLRDLQQIVDKYTK
jgi:predicted nucleotidyltransferase